MAFGARGKRGPSRTASPLQRWRSREMRRMRVLARSLTVVVSSFVFFACASTRPPELVDDEAIAGDVAVGGEVVDSSVDDLTGAKRGRVKTGRACVWSKNCHNPREFCSA